MARHRARGSRRSTSASSARRARGRRRDPAPGARAQPLGARALRARLARRRARSRSGGAGRSGTPSTTPSTSSAGAGSSSASSSTCSRCSPARSRGTSRSTRRCAPPLPTFPQVFSAFGVGLLGNAVLPARAGELARVAVLRRHLPGTAGDERDAARDGVRAPAVRPLPDRAARRVRRRDGEAPALGGDGRRDRRRGRARRCSRSRCSARRRATGTPRTGRAPPAGCSRWRGRGSPCSRAPAAAFAAILLQIVGWALQLLAVWAVTAAFDLDVPLPAAALVLLLMNVATVFPLWPGNVGLLQAAVALPLVQYGVAYGTGFAFGLVLQAVEMSVGVGVGLVMLAREGSRSPRSSAWRSRRSRRRRTSSRTLEEARDGYDVDEADGSSHARVRGAERRRAERRSRCPPRRRSARAR